MRSSHFVPANFPQSLTSCPLLSLSPYCNCKPPNNTPQCCQNDGFEYTRGGYGQGKKANFSGAKRAEEFIPAVTAAPSPDVVEAPGLAARAAAMVAKRQVDKPSPDGTSAEGSDESIDEPGNENDDGDTEPPEEMNFQSA